MIHINEITLFSLYFIQTIEKTNIIMNRNSILFISLFFFSLNVAAQSIYEGKLGGKYGVVDTENSKR